MSGKRIIAPYTMVKDGDMSSMILSPITVVRFQDNAVITLQFSGNPTGVFEILTSIDGIFWSALNLTITAGGSADAHTINLNAIPFDMIRIRYTPTSGTGALNAKILSKTVGL